MTFDNMIKRLADPAERARIMAALKTREAERLAAMSPEVRAEYERERKLEEERDQWLGERSTLTNGEIERDRDQLEQTIDAAQADAEEAQRSLSHALDGLGHMSATAAQATRSQGGTDRENTKLKARIAELERERDEARRAYVELLDATGKGGAK